MNCLNNPKKFLWFKYNGDHENSATMIYKFMPSSEDFIIDWECKLCGAKKIQHFVNWDELLYLGLTNEQIQKAYNGITLTFNKKNQP